MNLFRLIITALAVWIAYRIWQNFRAKSQNMPPPPKTPRAIPDMVECAVCQMHVPENEALRKGNKIYCSRQHLESDN